MKYFQGTLIKNQKKVVEYVMAETKMEAMSKFNSMPDATTLKVTETSYPLEKRLQDLLQVFKDQALQKKVNVQEFLTFLRQISVMTNAGISIRDVLSEAVASTEDKQIKRIGQEAADDIAAGINLSKSLEKFEKEIGGVTIAMIRVGEQTGRLSESINTLSNIIEEIKQNVDKVKKASKMPIISVCALLGAFITMILLVVPKFKDVFSRLGSDLPMPTQTLIFTNKLFTEHGLTMLAVLVVVFVAHIKIYNQKYNYQLWFDKLTLKMYIIGDISKFALFGRYYMILAELIKAGIPLSDALETALGIVDNVYLKEVIGEVNASINKGVSLAQALEETGLFEKMIIQMVKAGEAGGELDIMLERVADYYKLKFQSIVDNISSLIEPLLMFFIAGMVLWLALGIFLPMWDMASAAKGG